MIYFSSFIVGVFSVLPFLVQRFTGKFIYFSIFALIAIGVHGTFFFGSPIILSLVFTYIISTIAELLSLKTRMNWFGVSYRYDIDHKFFSSRLRFFGVYPLEISFAWVIFKYISIMIGMIIISAFSLSAWWELILIPCILVSVDFIVDPVAVNVSRLWEWKKGSGFYGIPWQNFLGWYGVGFVSTAVMALSTSLTPLTFHYLLLLPVLFYASLLKNTPHLIRLNARLGLVAAIPVAVWTLLGGVSLLMLFYKS